MKAVSVKDSGVGIEISERAIPTLKQGEALVKWSIVVFCHTDLHVANGILVKFRSDLRPRGDRDRH